jgi:hypothetical protein
VPGWVRVQRGEEGAGEQVRRRRHRWCAGGEGGGGSVGSERSGRKSGVGDFFLFLALLGWLGLRCEARV